MIEFVLTSTGTHRLRFAVSPLDETLVAIQVIMGLRRHPSHVPWLQVASTTMEELPIAELLTVLSDWDYICEFLSPPPAGPDTTATAQLAEVRRTDPAQVARELALVRAADLSELWNEPARARDLLADQLEIAWQELLAPHWPLLRDVLTADIGYRSTRLANGGFELAIADLHPDVRLVNGSVADKLVIRSSTRSRSRLDRRGLLLVPSVFAWPRVGVIAVPPWQPTVLYPARGVGSLWGGRSVSDRALSRVVGRTKAMLLLALDEPLTTSTLARQVKLAPATVSEHLGALRDGGLLKATRQGRVVLYSRSYLGEEFVRQ